MGDQPQTRKAWWEITSALTPLILGLCVTGVGVVFTNVYNFRQLQLNQLATLERLHGSLVSDNDNDREFAYATFDALGYRELAFRLISIKNDSAGRALVQEVKARETGIARAEASAVLSRLSVFVYMQIAAEQQRAKAQIVRTALQKKGYLVPGIENIAGKADAPKQTAVRYFNEDDKANANTIIEILKDQGVLADASLMSRLKARPGSIEIWFSADAL